jgi:AcrR family transcriptional regulator
VENATPRRDAQRNRIKIMTAARELFATEGIDVTLDDVARHAGVGVATAYRNFANKDLLIDDLLVERIEEMVRFAERALEEPDPWRALRSFLDSSLALQLADRGLKQVLWARSTGHQRIRKAREGLAPAIIELVERAKAAGVVRADVQPTDITLINLMVGTAIDFSRDVEPGLYPRYLEMLMAGLRPDAPAPAVPALSVEQMLGAMEAYHSR